MSGYTPVFRTVFEGSLCGQYPDTAAWLFLLALADKNGHVDKTPQYISAVTGMPVDVLLECIGRFMQPDPMSRSPDSDGRRLTLIDPTRPWGWSVVNHQKYREKARLAAKNADAISSGRDALRKRSARMSAGVRRCPPVSDPSDADTDTDKREKGATLQDDWSPDPIHGLPDDFDIEAEAGKFRNHYRSTGGVRIDWQAAWRNWCQRAVERGYAKRRAANDWSAVEAEAKKRGFRPRLAHETPASYRTAMRLGP